MTMEQDTDLKTRLLSLFGYFAPKRPQKSEKPASLRSRQLEAWLQTDVFLQKDHLSEAEPETVQRTLGAFEQLVRCDSDSESESNPQQLAHKRYPKRRRMAKSLDRDLCDKPRPVVRIGKRGRDYDNAIQELAYLDRDRKKRRLLQDEVPTDRPDINDHDADLTDLAVLMRRHLVSLDNALRRNWVCVCQKCSGLSVRLSLPPVGKNLKAEASFEVFFGVRSVPAYSLQEAKITVKDLHHHTSGRASEAIISSPPDTAHICENITESLNQRNRLHFTLQDGMFQRLRPQPKTFGSDRMCRTVSLSALFNRQQELLHGKSVLPLKGKRVLAVILASALLPFLETPWLQFSFDHSKIHFFEPRQDGELPDIRKPFLVLEHVPITSICSESTRDGSDISKHMVHPNASVLALGILLCELHFCTPVRLMAEDPQAPRTVNDDYYTCLDKLQTMKDDACEDYYLATKACLTGEYYPIGENAGFEDVNVQRLFYQDVVKRLEAVTLKGWGIGLENLGSFGSRETESWWGYSGREVVRLRPQTRSLYHSKPDDMSGRFASHQSNAVLQMSAKACPVSKSHKHADPSKNSLYLFDASHQEGSEKESSLSKAWMDNLQSSIYPFIDLGPNVSKPVRIAILDSGLDLKSPFLIGAQQSSNPQIKDARNFAHGTQPHDVGDEIGHGTHALGLLLTTAPCTEIFVAKIARREISDRNTYDDIAKAIDHAVEHWKVDIITMSFGIREEHDPLSKAISNALSKRTMLFAAASNDGGNLGRAFPAQHSSVFCIHSTDGSGNPSNFNPTASETDVNFSILGESVSSHWPAGMNGHHQVVNVMSGTSVATPIAAGLAASILSFARQQDENIAEEKERLGPWLKGDSSMDAVFKSMAKRRSGYDYIRPHVLFDNLSTREDVYGRIKDIKRNMYRYQ